MSYLQTESTCSNVYQDEHLEVNFDRGTVHLDSRQMILTRKERELLSLLVENAGELNRREVLLLRVWGYSPEIRTRTLDVHIRRLRKKLGRYGDQYIETIFGMGYRFQRFRELRSFPGIAPTLMTASA
jgi:DNA-binding response OmpR family regulator